MGYSGYLRKLGFLLSFLLLLLFLWLGDDELGFSVLLFGSEEIERLKFRGVCVFLWSGDGEKG